MSQSYHPLPPANPPAPSPHDRTAWLKGGTHRCLTPLRPLSGPAWRIILLGAPDATKHTLAELLSERLGACRLSIGDIFNQIQHAGADDLSPAIQNALDYLKRGEPVPDETILNMVSERLDCLQCSGGFVLDGFPQTVAQAKALDQVLESHDLRLSAVFDYASPVSSKENLPSDAAKKPVSAPETTGKSLKDFYWQQGLLRTLSAQGSPEEIFRASLRTLQLD